jgi:cytochrome c-type biogenesis protein
MDMEALFVTLTQAVTGTPLIALSAALAWGILSVVLSPCHLASIPLIVGFIDGQGRMSTRRAFVISNLFAVGILLTIAAIGIATAAAGRMMGDIGAWGNWAVAAIFFLVGLACTCSNSSPCPGRVRAASESPARGCSPLFSSV